MEILQLNEKATKEIFATMLAKRNLVPVIGAGFTKGQPTSTTKVPDGEEFRLIMLKAIKDAEPSRAIEAIANKKFHEIAAYFMKDKFVPSAERKRIIARYFTGVKLAGASVDFLNANWPYIYTLNIDDAIENNSRFAFPVLPYVNISPVAKEAGSVYKIHGDAKYETVHEPERSIIFSTDSYVQSLTANESMLASLRTDVVEQNTIFVGCRLDYELDLLYALAAFKGSFPPGRKSIFLCTSPPNWHEEEDLAKYGITTALVAPSYDEFYNWFSTTAFAVGLPKRHLSAYTVKSIDAPLENDRRENIRHLVKSPESAHGANILPDYYVPRDILPFIQRELDEKNFVMIRGRRYSGRTTLLRAIAKGNSSRNIFLFDSAATVGPEVIEDIRSVENGLVLFDSNSLREDTAYLLTKNFDRLKGQNTRAVVVVNRTEPEVVGIMTRYIEDSADFELDLRFSLGECDKINGRFDRLGMRRFDSSKTILNNTFSVLRSDYSAFSTSIMKVGSLSREEEDVILILAICDKCLSSCATLFNVRGGALFDLAKKAAPVVDLSETTPAELADWNSRHKLVQNSQVGLRLLVRSILNNDSTLSPAERLHSIAKRLLGVPKFASIGRSVIMFDAINDLLEDPYGGEIKSGYRPTVRALYEMLGDEMHGSSLYWLQRAKAAYNIETSQVALMEGIDFGRKAAAEAGNIRHADNAEFTVALLYGKLCHANGYKEFTFVKEAVERFAHAIHNYDRNPNYVKSLIMGGEHRKNSFELLCDHLEGDLSDPRYLQIKGDVKYLIEVRTNNARRRRRKS